MNDIRNVKKVHFVGMGGIGVSAIARMFLRIGKEVSGSDRDRSLITDELEKLGATFLKGHRKENVPIDADLLVYTIAAPEDNEERAYARAQGIPEMSYPEVLGEISRDKYTIAVAGTHGKTTTTAMFARIMIDAGLNPTVIVGSILKDVQSNFVAGDSEYLVVEACEYKRSFLNLHPNILVITNIQADHLDYYKDIDDIKKAFVEMEANVKPDGSVVTSEEYRKAPDDFQLYAPGRHNIENAQAAYTVARALGITDEEIRASLEQFSGTWRRFDFLGTTKEGALVYDDYAHHPDEVRATLAGVREKYPDAHIVSVFQPHLYSRTKMLMDDFARCFVSADSVVVAPIYAAREIEDADTNHHMLVERVRDVNPDVSGVGTFQEACEKARSVAGSGDVVVVMGAGDIRAVGERLVEHSS